MLLYPRKQQYKINGCGNLRYKLIEGSLNDLNKPIETVLKNRGITDVKQYLNLDESVVQDYNDLRYIQEAVDCFYSHFNERHKILVMPDEDTDGYTSSAMLYLYIKALDPNYPIEYLIHSRPKMHGLKGELGRIPDDVKLFIIADASTNDVNECNQLIEKGIDVIVCDHHDENVQDEEETAQSYNNTVQNKAIIINNQLSPEYKNKHLSGAGIVYRFLQALDETLWENYADDFLDLCMLGNVADVMDMRSLETRYFVNQGLNSIKNKFIQALASAQEFSTNGVINIHNVAWYFSPVLNSVTRMGSFEERDLVFKAMIEEYEEFDYKKRDGTIIKENIYDRAARIAKNVKSRQDKQRDLVFNELKDSVDINDKVIILESKKAQSGLVGLSCMKLSDTLKRAVIVLKEIERDGKTILSGSCRNFDGSPIENLKDLVLQTKAFEFCSGHGNAAGLAILPENLKIAKAKFNELLQDVDFNAPIPCDFIIDINDLDIGFIRAVDQAKWIWGTGVKEPQIAVENIIIQRSDIHVQGKNFDSIAFTINDIKFVSFKLPENDSLLEWANVWDGEDTDEIVINAVVEVGLNEYKGTLTAQCVIKEYMVIE